MQQSTNTRSYEPVAWFYERLTRVTSLGQYSAVKASQLAEMSSGSRVLYVGVGSGEDAILAARHGAQVTCLDLSAAMLAKARRRIDAQGLCAEFVCGDVMEYEPVQPFDIVTANFFLNIFPESLMQEMLLKLVTLVRPGGKMLIADFAPPRGNLLAKGMQVVYYRSANLFYWTLRLAPLHPIYDYARYLDKVGLRECRSSDFRLSPLGPYAFRNLVAIREERSLEDS